MDRQDSLSDHSFHNLRQNLLDFSEKLSNQSGTSSNSLTPHFVDKKKGITVLVFTNFLRQYVQAQQKNPLLRVPPTVKRQKHISIKQQEQWECYKIQLGTLIDPLLNYNKSSAGVLSLLAALNEMTGYSLLPGQTLLPTSPESSSPFWNSTTQAVHLSFHESLLYITLRRVPSQQARSYLNQVYSRSKCQFQQTVRHNLDHLYKKVLSQTQQIPPQSTQLEQIQRLKMQFSLSKNLLLQQLPSTPQPQSHLSSSTNESPQAPSLRSTTRFVINIRRRVSIQ